LPVTRSSLGDLSVFRVVLLVQLFTELASAVTVHPGSVLVDAIRDIDGGIDVIIEDKKIPVECLGKEGHQ